MRLGLIAGNGRFPFLVLDAARARRATTSPSSPLKEEAFPELGRARPRAAGGAIHWVSLGQLGKCISAAARTPASPRR